MERLGTFEDPVHRIDAFEHDGRRTVAAATRQPGQAIRNVHFIREDGSDSITIKVQPNPEDAHSVLDPSVTMSVPALTFVLEQLG